MTTPAEFSDRMAMSTDHTPPDFDLPPSFFSASAANPTPPKVNGALSWGIGLMAFGWIAVAAIVAALMWWGAK